MECTRLGAPRLWPRPSCGITSGVQTHPVEPSLAASYQAFRACVRVKLALSHLGDDVVDDAPKWQRRAGEYLTLARRYAAELG